MEILVFVYGTLRKGMRLHEFIKDAECISTKACAKGILYDIGDFPAAKFSGNGQIIGEVYSINTKQLKTLDYVEGFIQESKKDSMYWRRKITVDTDNGPQIVFAYEWNRAINNLPIIETGDYKLYKRAYAN